MKVLVTDEVPAFAQYASMAWMRRSPAPQSAEFASAVEDAQAWLPQCRVRGT